MSGFFRFPHTPHLAWLGSGEPRDDKVLSSDDAANFLAEPVLVEEKLDGANLGFSVSPEGALQAQNRGHYLHEPYSGQFSRLGQWLNSHEDRLFDALGDNLIAFGEWCAARHSLAYSALPDWWLLFDIYDRRAGCFWNAARRDALAERVGLLTVPSLSCGMTNLQDLERVVRTRRSAYRDGPLEGVVVRREDGRWLSRRAKLVRPDFTQQITGHWRGRSLEWNRMSDVALQG